MKKTFLFFALVFSCFMFSACNSDEESLESINSTSNVSKNVNEDVVKLLQLFESKHFKNLDEAASYARKLAGNVTPITRAVNEEDFATAHISPEAYRTLEEMKSVKIDTLASLEKLRSQLIYIVENSKLDKNSAEYQSLRCSADAAVEVIYYSKSLQDTSTITRSSRTSKGATKTSKEATKRSKKEATKKIPIDWTGAIRCIIGTIGSTGLGAVGGAGAGTFTLPIIGTISGTALGAVSGAMVGCATFC